MQPKTGNGFLTAYFEPEILASQVRTPEFPVPVLGRPADLVTFAQDEPRPQGIDAVYAAARVNEGVYSIFLIVLPSGVGSVGRAGSRNRVAPG